MRIVTVLMVLVILILFGFGTKQTALGSDTDRIAKQQAIAKVAICKVFGSYCQEALRVSWCESRWYVWARNGQYWGIFQMGYYARSKYGHGSGPYAQARAAKRYFYDSGRDWSPWSCKP